VTDVTHVGSLLSICGFVSITVVFMLAVVKLCLTTVLVMPQYVPTQCSSARYPKTANKTLLQIQRVNCFKRYFSVLDLALNVCLNM